MKPLIIYHGQCPDGFGSAWWLQRNLEGGADLHPGKYGEAPPDVAGRDLFIVDFCYPTDELEAIAASAATVLVLDHHQTSEGWLADTTSYQVFGSVDEVMVRRDLPTAVLDKEHSGVGLVIQYVLWSTGMWAPWWLGNIQDRDLWQFKMEHTPEIFAAISSRPYTVEAWDEMLELSAGTLLTEGTAIERWRNKLIEDTVATAFETEIGGHEVWCAASPYAIGSDVAGELAKRKPKLFGAYFVDYGTKVRFGLRSTPTGLDVAALAAKWWDGGGHKHAAGFEIGDWWWSWEHHHDLTDWPSSRGLEP